MIEITILAVLLILSAFFSSAETALTTVSRLKVSQLVEKKVYAAKIIEKLKEKPSDFLATILIGNNLVNIAAAALATSIFINASLVWGVKSEAFAVGIATAVMTFLVLVFGEIIPKTIAIRYALQFSLFFAPIILILNIIFMPIAYIIGIFSRPVIYLFKGKTPEKSVFVTEEDIRMILAAGEKEGVIEEQEREMITSIFEFGDTIVREVMTPRPDMTAAPVEITIDALKQLIIDTGHSRIPIYEGNLDNITGVVYAKDLLKTEKEFKIREILRPAIFIPEAKKISELMHEMQAARTHIAIIVDEFGVVAGVVSMEDLIEEIVGEIHDEFERGEKKIEKIDENTFIVNGLVSLKDINDELVLDLPEKEKEYDTIGGFVFNQLGKMPSVGDVIRLEKVIMSVERIHRRRITRLKIKKRTRGLEEELVGG